MTVFVCAKDFGTIFDIAELAEITARSPFLSALQDEIRNLRAKHFSNIASEAGDAPEHIGICFDTYS